MVCMVFAQWVAVEVQVQPPLPSSPNTHAHTDIFSHVKTQEHESVYTG